MNIPNTLRMGLLAAVTVIALLMVGFIIGIVDGSTLQDTGTKVILVIGVVTLAFIAVTAIAGSKKK